MDGQAKRVTIYMGETDQWHHQPAYMGILEFLRREGCAGATVERGLAGFGANSRIKTASILDVSLDLPVIITWIDRPDRVERLLPELARMVPAGLITVEDVSVYHYSSTLREGLPDVRVEEVMTREVTTIHPEAPLAEVVEKLLDKDYTALPVVDSTNRVVGIISDTDLLQRGDMEVSISLKKSVDPALARNLITRLRRSVRTVAEVMTTEPITIAPQASLSEAARAMSRMKLKRLPVVDSEKHLLGIISRLNILNVLAAAHLPQEARTHAVGAHPARAQSVAEVMDTDVPTVSAETGLSDVLALLARTRVKRVVVVDAERRVVGIISDTDLVVRMSRETHPGILEQLMSRLPLGSHSAEARNHLQKARSKTAADLMTRDVVTLSADSPIGTALALSAEKHIKRFPVVDATGKLAGIVGRTELLSALVGDAPASHLDSDGGEA
jgi:CBS domain-containing protein